MIKGFFLFTDYNGQAFEKVEVGENGKIDEGGGVFCFVFSEKKGGFCYIYRREMEKDSSLASSSPLSLPPPPRIPLPPIPAYPSPRKPSPPFLRPSVFFQASQKTSFLYSANTR